MAIVVITGASSGIGAATARILAARGHKLALAARRTDRLEQLAAELAPLTEVLVVPTDVSDPLAVAALAQQAATRFGTIDVWINNAGVGNTQFLLDTSGEEVQRHIAINLTGPILGARAALPWMMRQGCGHIINIGSVAGAIGVNGTYSATKFGLRGHTDALRREVGRYGVRVSLVAPGFVRSEMTRDHSFPMPGPEVVGHAIARLLTRPRREVVVPGWYRLLIWLAVLSPGLVDWLLARIDWREAGRRTRPQSGA